MSKPTQRRRAEETRELILDAATELFLRQGFTATNLEQVAGEAGVTKPTVYSHFKSKTFLFSQVIGRYAGERVKRIERLKSPSGNVAQDLQYFGEVFLEAVFSPDSQRWHRLAASESLQNPDVGQTFFDVGPKQVLELLSGYLRSQKKAGRLNCKHPQRGAEQLIGMLLGLDHVRSLHGQPVAEASQRKRICREAVNVFLAAYEVDDVK